MSTLAELLASLSPDAHTRGGQFETICQWFLKEAPYYRPHVANVWLWDDWPGRWAADAGIDLVVETHGGQLWAIQAKAYDEDYSIRKSDVDTFLSESARTTFSYRLLIATTDRIGARAAATLDGQAIPVGLVLRSHLEAHPISWPDNVDTLIPRVLVTPKRPREASQKAIRAVRDGFRDHDRGQLIMACGTGKTLVGLWTAEALSCRSVLVLVPSLSLVAQALREWTDNWEHPRAVLAVCSDESVSHDVAMSRSRDLGIPVTTDVESVAGFLAGDGGKVTFATYQSSDVLVEAAARAGHRFDLCIADEAHRCAGASNGPFGQVLDDARLPAARRLFMTATPRLLTERLQTAATAAGFEVASMSDPAKFGPVFHRLTFGEAVEQGLLTDYRVVVSVVNDPGIRQAVESRALWQHGDMHGGKPVGADTLVAVATVAKGVEKYALRRVVTFHTRVQHARTFAAELSSVAQWLPMQIALRTGHVNGEMTSGRRLQVLRMLELGAPATPVVVTNARCLTEGVDIPTLDGVVFVDPRESQIDIVQAVGRVMRKAPGKANGTILLPLALDSAVLEGGSELEPRNFAHVWRVIRALRAHDDVLAEELDQLRRELGRRGGCGLHLPDRIVLDLPQQITPEVFEALTLAVVEATTDDWEFYFGRLQAFIEEGGTAAPQRDVVMSDGTAIGSWVGRQRGQHRRGMLRADRVSALEQLPGWTWDELSDRWQRAYGVLLRWVADTGTAKVPTTVTYEGFRLGAWVSVQRTAYLGGRLSEDRARALESLAGWTWDTLDDRWIQGHAALLRWVARNGTAAVPNTAVQEGFRLGRWLDTQRRAYKRQQLTPTATATLEALPGWSWNVQRDSTAGMLSRLRSYQKREGHTLVPVGHYEDGRRLGYWVNRRRRDYARGVLAEEQVGALEAVPTWVWTTPRQQVRGGPMPITPAWRAMYELAKDFAAREGHASIPSRHVVGDAALGRWVHRTRMLHRGGVLHPEAVALMEQLPGWFWDPQSQQWQKGYDALLAFVEGEGHASPGTSKHPVLAEWAKRQRSQYRTARLSPERVALLEAVPGWDWGTERGGRKRVSGVG